MSYTSDNEFALLKRAGVAIDGPNLGKPMTVLGNSFMNDRDDYQHFLLVHSVPGTELIASQA